MDPFVAEIRIFACNFAPNGWATCYGQILPISQNTALFSLLGTTYGGNGESNFALPDLQRRVPLHAGWGPGPGLTERFLGETGGSETIQLIETEMPAHYHQAAALSAPASSRNPNNAVLARSRGQAAYQTNSSSNLVSLAPNSTSITGASTPHNNMMPFLTLNFCIALFGVFPPRS